MEERSPHPRERSEEDRDRIGKGREKEGKLGGIGVWTRKRQRDRFGLTPSQTQILFCLAK